MTDIVDFTPTVEEDQNIVVDFSPTSVPKVSEPAALDRSKKFNFALQDRSPGENVLYHEITSKGENERRQVIRDSQYLEANRQRQEAVKQYIEQRPKGMPLQTEEVDILFGREAAPATVSDNDVSLEREYAKQVMLTAMNEIDMDRSTITRIMERNGVDVKRVLNNAEKVITAKEGFQKLFEEYEKDWNDRSIPGQVLPYAATFVPFYSWWSTQNAYKDARADSWFAGSNRREQIQELLRVALKDPEEAVQKARETVARIHAVSPRDALDFAKKLVSYSSSDENLANVFSALELATAPGAFDVARGLARVTGAAAGAVKATGNRALNLVGLIDATGNVERAAQAALVQQLRTKTAATTAQSFDDIANNAISVFNPGSILTNSRFMGREALRRMETELTRQGTDLMNAVVAARQDERLLGQVADTAFRRTSDLARSQYASINNAILDIRPVAQQDTIGNVSHIAIDFGKRDGTLYKSQTAAEKAAQDIYKLKDYTVENHGSGYYIRVTKPVNETDHDIRNALQVQTNHTTPRSLLSTISEAVGGVRSADHTLSEKTIRDLKATTFGGAQLQGILSRTVDEAFGPLKRGNKASWNRFQTYVTRQRDYEANGVRGRYDASQGEFEANWHRDFGRAPSEAESKAYWSYVQLSDADLTIRNWNLLRDKQRLGLEMFELPWRPSKEVVIPDRVTSRGPVPAAANQNVRPYEVEVQNPFGGNTKETYPGAGPSEDLSGLIPTRTVERGQTRTLEPANDNAVKVPQLEGRYTTTVPWATDRPASLVIWDATGANFRIINTKYATAVQRAEVEALMANDGYKLIHLSDQGTRDLAESGILAQASANNAANVANAHYILTPSTKTSSLPLQQIPRRPGGHIEFQDGWFIRQPVISYANAAGRPREMTYYGDTSFMHFINGRDAERYNTMINEARLLWNDNAALDAYIQQHMPHVFNNAGDFKSQFHVVGLDPELPLFVSRKDINLDASGQLNGLLRSPDEKLWRFQESEHNLYRDGVSFQYLGERDADRIRTVVAGQPTNPHLVDPITTLLDANNQLLRSTHIGELKIKSSEHFIAEFGHLLDATPGELRAHPLSWLLEPKWKKGADKVELGAAQAFRRSVVSLMGEKSNLEKHADYIKSGIAERFYNAGAAISGKQGGEAAFKFATNTLDLPLMKDPIQFARNMAFHAKMGLFNLAQFPLQLQTLFHTAAVSPTNAPAAFGGMFLQRWLGMTNKQSVMDGVARMATRVGWSNPDHFLESYRLMRETGFARVGREYANIGDFVSETAINSKLGKFLHAGTSPFREAETMIRYNAWNVAYLEFRKANPTRVIRDADRMSILKRADDLSNNMTAASDAGLQKNSLLSIPLQFVSYQARITENILAGLVSGRGPLNRAEAARAMVMQSALYGLPVGIGSAIGVWPVYEEYKKYLLDKGVTYDAKNDPVRTILTDGVQAYISEIATGTKFNAGERYGAGGISLLKDIFQGTDDERWKAITGASGGVMRDVLKAFSPLVLSYTNMAKEDGYPLKAQDLIDATSSISSVNNTMKLWYALNFQKYISKTQGAMADVTAREAWISYLSGLPLSDISDMYKLMENGKTRNEVLKKAEAEFTKNIRLSVKAYSEGRYEEGASFQTRASAHLTGAGFTPQERVQAMSRAMKDEQDQLTSVFIKHSRQDKPKFNAAMEVLRRRKIITDQENN